MVIYATYISNHARGIYYAKFNGRGICMAAGENIKMMVWIKTIIRENCITNGIKRHKKRIFLSIKLCKFLLRPSRLSMITFIVKCKLHLFAM